MLAGPALSAPLRIGAATQGYNYFNRVGATTAQHDEDLKACFEEVRWVTSADTLVNGGFGGAVGSGSGALGALLVGMMGGGVGPSAIENCMLIKGWRVALVPEAKGVALWSADKATINAALSPLIGADLPPDQIARYWANDAANGTTKRFDMRPPRSGVHSLSLKLLDKVELPEGRDFTAPKLKQTKPLDKMTLASDPPGQAILIFHVRGASRATGFNALFMRMTDDGAAYAQDGEPNFLGVGRAGEGYDAQQGAWRAFAITPGLWRFYGINSGITDVDLCFGSPAVMIKAGEVIYGGDLDLSSTQMNAVMTGLSAQDWLSAHPELAARVKPAAYTNGWTSTCFANTVYALEFEGFPFKPGYSWGSRAAARR